jgi:hypothetical protein
MSKIGNEAKLILKLATERMARINPEKTPIPGEKQSMYTMWNGVRFDTIAKAQAYSMGFRECRKEYNDTLDLIAKELES